MVLQENVNADDVLRRIVVTDRKIVNVVTKSAAESKKRKKANQK